MSDNLRNAILQKYIGKTVTVVIDRPIGYFHPKFPDMKYPVNYGYIENIFAADGEEQDAYVLGVNKPVAAFTGVVIAAIRREDDVEDKWIVAPAGTRFSDEEIFNAVYFLEKFFISRVYVNIART